MSTSAYREPPDLDGLKCRYPRESDGTPCGAPARYIVQRMPNDYNGPHKYVVVCGRHAALWRRRIPYAYIVDGDGKAYPGQTCRSPYERRYAQESVEAA